MAITSFVLRGKGLSSCLARNLVNSAANSQILYGLKTFINDLQFEEIAEHYDIANRRMLRATLKSE